MIDEAQFRTLMQVDRRRAQAGSVVDNNLSGQETIVGTNALLANGMVAKVAYAADKGNTLTVQDNSIHVPHGQYVLIDNGTFLTAVRAEAMRHWTAPRESIVFAEAPQNIDIPRLGPVYRFERTLLKANDTLVIQLSYQWEGDAK